MDPAMCAWSEDSDYNGSVLDDKTLKHAKETFTAIYYITTLCSQGSVSGRANKLCNLLCCVHIQATCFILLDRHSNLCVICM